VTLNFASTPISRIFIKPFSTLRLSPGLLILGIVCLGFNVSYAHDVKPVELRIILGDSRSFTVADLGSCSALITVESSDTSIATVNPAFIDAVSADFTVQASGSNTGEVTILVQWVGEDVGGEGFCQEISADTLTVKVIDPNENSSGNNDNSGEGNDPVNTYNGELYFTEPYDLYLEGPIPLYFQRYYASHLAKSFVIGDLGDNWLHNYDWHIHWVGNVITLITDKGKVLKYLSDGAGNWTLQTATDMPIPLVQEMTEILLRNPEDNYIYRFSAEGKLAEIFDGKGNVLTFTYLDVFPDWRKLGEITDNLGRTLVFNYVYVGNLRKIGSVHEKQGSTFRRFVSFTYDDSFTGEQHLKTVQDARFGSTTYTYKDTQSNADKALLLSKTLPRFNIPLRQTFFDTSAQFDSGKVETQTDADGNITTFTYSGTTTTMTDPAAATMQHNHDSSGSLTSSTDKRGNVINITNDASKRRIGVQDSLGNSTTFNFDATSGMVNSFADRNGNTTSYSYGSRTVNGVAFQDLTGISYADGTTESLSYDLSGNLVSHTDQAGYIWTYSYNSLGQLTSITNPLNGVSSMTYSGDGTRSSLTDAGSNTTTFAYDNNKRMNVTTFADTTTASSFFNEHNKLTSSTDERGNTTQRAYDANGNLTRVTDASGAFITHTYDTMDRVVSTADALTNSSTVTYDILSRPTVFTNRLGLSSTTSYDLSGNITQVVDRGFLSWQASFADNGNVASTTNPLSQVTSYQYDPEGNLTSRSTPLGNQTLFTFDSMNRMSSQT